MEPEDWQDWLREPWAAVPALDVVPRDPDVPVGWVIIKRKELASHRSPVLGPLYEDEESARHIARAHNYYLSAGLLGEHTDGGSESKNP